MQKSDAKKGMKVVFGRGGDRAAKAVGVIEKCNPARAKVKITEQFNSHEPGTVFNVPYAIMEQLPESGDKDDVKIVNPGRRRNGDDVEIVVGETTFHSVYADSNACWRVKRKEGRNYRCRIEDDNPDYGGTEKIFSPEEIRGSIGMSNLFQGLADSHDAFYKALTPGQTIHYHNSFNQWVRCEVVAEGGENKLRPVALVGEWRSHDLPKRMRNGEIYNGYHAEQILKGETFAPNASNLFEAGYKPKNGVDPTTLTPISLAVPDMTEDEEATAVLWQKVEAIADLTSRNTHDKNPKDILNAVRNLAVLPGK